MIAVWSSAKRGDVQQLVGSHLDRLGADYVIATHLEGLELTKDDVILAMGPDKFKDLQAWGICPKNGSIKSLRDRKFRKPDGSGPAIILSWAPGIVNTLVKMRPQIQWDATLAHRMDSTGQMRAPALDEVDYKWVDNLDVLCDRVVDRFEATGEPVLVSLDLETMGHYPYYPDRHILTSQWTIDVGESFMVDHREDDGTPCGVPTSELPDKMREQITWLLTTGMIQLIGTNLKGDLQWISLKWMIECLNFVFDTVLGGGLLNENRHNSLNAQTKEYAPDLGGYDDAFSLKTDKGHLELQPRFNKEFTVYAGGDSDATMRCAKPIIAELTEDPQLGNFYKELVHPAARAFEKIEMRGVVVDLAQYKKLRTEVKAYIREKTKEAMAMIPIPIRARYSEKLTLTRPRMLVDFLFTRDGLELTPDSKDGFTDKMKPHRDDYGWETEPATSMDHLGLFRPHPEAGPFIQLIEDLGSARKTLSTYILNEDRDKGFLTHLHPDGRFHPAYALVPGALFDNDGAAGTNTGRLSAQKPAWQTVPKHTHWAKPLRRCFPAPPGYLCWDADFSQGELRVFACIANELLMLEAYRLGMDLHGITAAMANDIDVQTFLSWKDLPKDDKNHIRWEKLRQGGKAGNFGLLYRMFPKGFQEYSWKTYGVVMTLQEATDFRDKWFATWPRVGPWHDEVVKEAYQTGMIRTPLGRIRHLPMLKSRDNATRSKGERQAINSRIQGTLSDLNLWAILGVEECFKGHDEELHTVGTIHDQLHGYVIDDAHTEQRMADMLGAVNRKMELVPSVFGWDHQIPFPLDTNLGPNLADMHEFTA